MNAENLSLKDMLRKIASGDAKVTGIANVDVPDGADSDAVIAAITNTDQARQLSSRGLALAQNGQFEEAIVTLHESVAVEESLGNTWGIASDLGNIGECYRELKQWKQAEEVFRRALRLVGQMLADLERSPERKPSTNFQIQDCHRMYGLDSEGLSRTLIAVGRAKEAAPIVEEAIQAYDSANAEHEGMLARRLRDWLLTSAGQ